MVSYLKESIPKYSQLKDILSKEIKNGKFKEGDKFYSERKLVGKFNISRNTAVESLRILENEELIERIQGKGTFVSSRNRKLSNNTNNIAVVVSEIFEARHPASISLIKSIEKVLDKAGYHILLISLEHYSKKQQIDSLISQKKADAFILVSVPGEVHEWFASKNVPFVIIGNTLLKKAPHINVDYFKLVDEGISYLLELGHRKIGFVIGDKKNIGVMRGIRGYENAYNSLGLAAQSRYIMTDISNASNVIKATNNLIDAGATAILFDIHMFNYAVDEIRNRGLGIPEDISLMLATQKIRKINAKNSLLTGFEVDIDKTYRLAGKMIIALINGKEVKSKTVPYKFFEGNSCRRLSVETQNTKGENK
ncbi:MAG: GntR family transcriptional regulator [bacterium]|nr:GntR family transcriptional regulator [bacterium]